MKSFHIPRTALFFILFALAAFAVLYHPIDLKALVRASSQGTLRTLMRLFNFPQMKPHCTKTIKEDSAAGSRSFRSPKNAESADAVFILVQIKAGMRAHQCTLEILISRFAREAPFHDASIYDGIDFSQNSPRPNFIARVEGSQFGSIFI